MSEQIDGFHLEQWQRLFEFVKQSPGAFCDLMMSEQTPRSRSIGNVEVALLEHQISLRKKIVKKFVSPEAWVWNGLHLELASNELTSSFVASFFPEQVKVYDIGCGGGADAIALAQRGPVVAVDRNPFAVELTTANGRLQLDDSRAMQTISGNAEEVSFERDAWLHLDPDRRQDGLRSVALEWHSPGPATLADLVQRSAGGSMKLSPACHDSAEFLQRPITRHWIAFDRSVVQQRWWWGLESVADDQVWISSYTHSRGWTHEEIADFSKRPSVPVIHDPKSVSVGAYIGDGDPALRAARGQIAYSSGHDCSLLGSEDGYFLADREIPELALVRWRKVIAVLPFREKAIAALMKQHDFEGIELKRRQVGSVPAEIEKLAKRTGTRRCIVHATRFGERIQAIVTAGT